MDFKYVKVGNCEIDAFFLTGDLSGIEEIPTIMLILSCFMALDAQRIIPNPPPKIQETLEAIAKFLKFDEQQPPLAVSIQGFVNFASSKGFLDRD